MAKASFSKEQLAWIKAEYPGKSRKELHQAYNAHWETSWKLSQIISAVKNNKIRSGRDGRFVKGCASWNNGVKGSTPGSATSFKKGSVPKNLKPLGSERIDSKDGYIWIKVAESDPYTPAKTRYRQKHVWVWEQHNGAVPKGYMVSFIDGDRLNCSIDNLMLITRAQSLYLNRNGYSELPSELRAVMLSLAKVEVRRFELEKTT